MTKKEYGIGVREGIPVGLGYLSVSFGFGAAAAGKGLHWLQAALISLTNVTSAGQKAGLDLIAENFDIWPVSGLLLMILGQLIINSRYALMSIALSQKMGPSVGFLPRLRIAFVNTDEVFALAMARKEPLTVPYMCGLGVLPVVGWVTGTALGAAAGTLLPDSIGTALGVMLYGMFVAIVIPPAKKERSVAAAVGLALLFSCMFTWVPGLDRAPAGLPIVICTLAAAVICAILFPIPEEEET